MVLCLPINSAQDALIIRHCQTIAQEARRQNDVKLTFSIKVAAIMHVMIISP